MCDFLCIKLFHIAFYRDHCNLLKRRMQSSACWIQPHTLPVPDTISLSIHKQKPHESDCYLNLGKMDFVTPRTGTIPELRSSIRLIQTSRAAACSVRVVFRIHLVCCQRSGGRLLLYVLQDAQAMNADKAARLGTTDNRCQLPGQIFMSWRGAPRTKRRLSSLPPCDHTHIFSPREERTSLLFSSFCSEELQRLPKVWSVRPRERWRKNSSNNTSRVLSHRPSKPRHSTECLEKET